MEPEMEQSSVRGEQSKQRERANRILDVAADLLQRWGYKRVTIDDIARHAGVGKGTIYLHWKTRDALFETLLLRETVSILHDLLQRMYADPAEILLHRMMSSNFLITENYPLIKAMLTRDLELLGKLLQSSMNSAIQARETLAAKEYLALLYDHGLLRTDINLPQQLYALNAAAVGFYLVDPFLADEDKLSLEEQAHIMARTIRLAFEPELPPSPTVLQEIAPRVIQLFEQLCEHHERKMQEQTEI